MNEMSISQSALVAVTSRILWMEGVAKWLKHWTLVYVDPQAAAITDKTYRDKKPKWKLLLQKFLVKIIIYGTCDKSFCNLQFE